MNNTIDINTAKQRFDSFINQYEEKIKKEKAILQQLDPMDSCDDMLYELEIRRDALKKCYEHVFNTN